VRFDPPEGEEGESFVVPASCEEGSVNVTTPEELPAGQVRVFVSFDGVLGKWFSAGDFGAG